MGRGLLFTMLFLIIVAGTLAMLLTRNLLPENPEITRQQNPAAPPSISTDKNEEPAASIFDSFFGGGGGGTSSGGGGGGGGGTATTTSNSGTDPNCHFEQIPYGLINLEINQTCNSLQGQNCTDKTVKCELEIENLHEQISGAFAINFNFLDETRSILSSQQTTTNVNADSSQTIQVQDSFTSPEANEEITCSFNTLEVPQQEVCI